MKKILSLMLPVCSLFLSFSSCGSFAQQMLDNFTSNFTGTNSSTAKIGDNTNLTNAADYRKPSVNKNTPIATVSYMGGVYDVYSDHHAELKSVQLLYKQFIKCNQNCGITTNKNKKGNANEL